MKILDKLSNEAINNGHQFKIINSTLLISPDINIFQKNNPHFFKLVLERNLNSELFFNPSSLFGQFLIFYIKKIKDNLNSFTIITDCFCSIPCYFNLKDNYSLNPIESFEFDKFSLIDYLLTRRISAGFTFYKDIYRTEASQIVNINGRKIKKEKYFYLESDSYISNMSDLDVGRFISDKLNNSIFKLHSKKICSYFSGGMDSRFIIASAKENIDKLFTIGFSHLSREISTALLVSEYLDKSHLIEINSISLLEELNEYALVDSKHGIQANSLFRRFNPPKDHNAICGIGLDYLFQGMYSNFEQKQEVSSDSIPEDLFIKFLKLTSCKNRGFNKNILSKEIGDSFPIFLKEISRRRNLQIRNTFKGKLPLSKVFDLYLFATPSAHYTYSDYIGMISKSTTFIPLCNEIFLTIFASMKESARKDRKALRSYLKNDYNKLYKIGDANIGGGFERSYIDKIRSSLRAKFIHKRYEDHQLRTFPVSSYQILRGPARTKFWDLIHDGNYERIGLSKKFVIKQLNYLFKNPKAENIADNIHTIYTLLSLAK